MRDCQPGLRVTNPVSLADLMPTVLEMLRIPAPETSERAKFVFGFAGGEPMSSTPCYAEAETPLRRESMVSIEGGDGE